MKLYKFLLVCGCSLALPACQVIEGPTPMPSGYVNHAGDYNTLPGVKPANLGYEYSKEMSEESAVKWREAAADMVGKISNRFNDGDNLFVKASSSETPLTRTFDNFLREALVNAGYRISSIEDCNVVLVYDAKIVDVVVEAEDSSLVSDEEIEGEPVDASRSSEETQVELTVGVLEGDKVTEEESGDYTMPEAEAYRSAFLVK